MPTQLGYFKLYNLDIYYIYIEETSNKSSELHGISEDFRIQILKNKFRKYYINFIA